MNAGKQRVAEAEQARVAAAWLTRLDRSPEDMAVQEEFVAWLKADSAHVPHFLEMRALDVELVRYGQSHQAQVRELEKQLSAQVLPLPSAATIDGPAKAAPQETEFRERLRMRVAVGAAAVLALAYAANLVHDVITPVFETGVGESRVVLLEDGSTMRLNTRTRVDVRYSSRAREIRLHEGDALFDVVHDGSRPLRVTTSESTVEAIGTVFEVRSRVDVLNVTVAEGRVKVTPIQSVGLAGLNRFTQWVPRRPSLDSQSARLLGAGQQLRMGSTGADSVVTTLSPEALHAHFGWLTGRLTFSGVPIQEAVEELNRYNHQQIVVEDERLATRRIFGVFEAHDPKGFADTLASIYPGVVTMRAGETIHVSHAPSELQHAR